MNQEHQLILQELISCDKDFVSKIDPYMKSEAYQYYAFVVFSQFALGNEEMKIDKFLDDFLDINQYRINPKKDSKDFFDQLHFDFRRMLKDLDSNLEDFDNYTSKVSKIYSDLKYKVRKSSGLFSKPITMTDVESFLAILDQLSAVRSIINNYLAITCLVRKTFYFFPSETIIQILNSYEIDTSNFPNVINTMKHANTFYDFLFFTGPKDTK